MVCLKPSIKLLCKSLKIPQMITNSSGLNSWLKPYEHTTQLIRCLPDQHLLLLVYGSVYILPLEVQFPSLRINIASKIIIEQNANLQLEELNGLEEQHLLALQNIQLYQSQMVQAHDRLVRPWTFLMGEHISVLRRLIIVYRFYWGKFELM